MDQKTTGNLTVHAAGTSHVGRVRSKNQDNYLVSPEQGLFIVSDGMGGHQAGEVAAKVVVSVLPDMLVQRLALQSSLRSRVVELVMREAILELSQRLRSESTGHINLHGMGATLALAWLNRGRAHLAYMGDSRIYLLRQDTLTQLSEDHSLVALLLKHGEITPEEAKEHPARGRLSRYVGMEGEVYPDVQTVDLARGDRLLLCSDGLTGMLDDRQITQILQSTFDPQSACQALVQAANEAGGKDNITVVIVLWG